MDLRPTEGDESPVGQTIGVCRLPCRWLLADHEQRWSAPQLSGKRLNRLARQVAVQLRLSAADRALADALVQHDARRHDLIGIAGILGDDVAPRIDDEAALGVDECHIYAVLEGSRAHHGGVDIAVAAPRWHQNELR